jgi:diaminohydroxyphosphoribosylaminopyrimidine deaminase/5-amino-6-(5-phosphoribosylamino)uracil reductase
MSLALEEAKRGFPQTIPNPLVGCVIVYNNQVVSSGYHERFGGPHAEVNAVNGLHEDVDPGKCEVYLTLEPCSHYGKTPPCADFLIRNGFKKIIIATADPNPQVHGAGISRLRENNVEVITGVLARQARELNRPFMTFHEKKRPYVILKWAITADGFISRLPVPKNRESNFISRQEARIYAHRLRAQCMSVLVGKKTVLADNPSLTTRLVKGKNPMRIFIDRALEVPRHFNVYNNESLTLVFNGVKEGTSGNVRWIKLDFSSDIIPGMVQWLYELGIQSVLVEGGASLVNSFVDHDLWDEVLVFQNPDLQFGSGLKGPVFALKNTFELVGEDKLFHHYRSETMPQDIMPEEVF